MNKFIGEKVEVEYEQLPGVKVPKKFIWQGKTYEVAEVLLSWEDHGFGGAVPAKPRWWQRRHRVYFHIKTVEGDNFEIYWDRGAKKKVWILTKQL
jgi:hypothetical protein